MKDVLNKVDKIGVDCITRNEFKNILNEYNNLLKYYIMNNSIEFSTYLGRYIERVIELIIKREKIKINDKFVSRIVSTIKKHEYIDDKIKVISDIGYCCLYRLRNLSEGPHAGQPLGPMDKNDMFFALVGSAWLFIKLINKYCKDNFELSILKIIPYLELNTIVREVEGKIVPTDTNKRITLADRVLAYLLKEDKCIDKKTLIEKLTHKYSKKSIINTLYNLQKKEFIIINKKENCYKITPIGKKSILNKYF